MNILFLSLLDFDSLESRNIYTDLLCEFIRNNHAVYCISPCERRKKQRTHLIQSKNYSILKLKIGNIQKVNLIEKGISTLMVESQFIHGIKKYFSNVKFDLILYATPPITFARVVAFVKNRDHAVSYLMLKDIFPQNAVDIGVLKKNGLAGLLYHYFRKKEKRLYFLSDRIGCMSQANCDYILKHNPEISSARVEVCPNCIAPESLNEIIDENKKFNLREQYGFPISKTIFVYGGNLGRPQNVPFIIDCLKQCSNFNDVFFVIAGDGTDKYLLDEYVLQERPAHVKIMNTMPGKEYNHMIKSCDIGLIFLDYRFTIPNFPSRLLSYMQAGLPVLSCTDIATDVGTVITENKFGWSCGSDSAENFSAIVRLILSQKGKLKEFGMNGISALEKLYRPQAVCKNIIRGVKYERTGSSLF